MRRLLSLFAIPFLIWFAMPVHAGHLFTQAAANEPINLSSGTGLEITQLTYEGGGNSGSVSIDFDQTGSGDAALEWSAGDAVKVSIDSWTQTFSYDTLTSDFTTASQSTNGLDVTDPSLVAANITTGNATTTFTVIATAGQFRFEGYRIQVVDSRYNGTGADTITQDQVVSEDELGGGVFETAAESNQTSLGQHLDSLSGSATGELADVITILDAMTDESKALAMKLISPEQSQVLGQSATNNVSTGFDTVQVRLDSVRSGTTALSTASTQHHGQASGLSSGDDSVLERHAWLKAIGAKADRDSAGGFAGSDADFHGVMGGLDFTSDSQLTLGAAFAYGKTDVDMNDFRNGDGADIDTYQLTAYFSKSLDRVYFEGMLSYAYQNYETKRN
ncbi:autotransporter outer membrane beta-barrel domain-containing protein, partial [Methylophaga sp.]|uniref:autotransporter family protein n=1 Tax=Methylophaga sp. TaxID=2024840 RepID=UPI003F69631E